jgi:hypothetical protein
MKKASVAVAVLAPMLFSHAAHAAYQLTGWVGFDVRMDNGRTYFYPLNADGSAMSLSPCLYSRVELNDSGDSFGSAENGRRIMSMALTAKALGLRAIIGYDTSQAPACRVAEFQVEWPQ